MASNGVCPVDVSKKPLEACAVNEDDVQALVDNRKRDRSPADKTDGPATTRARGSRALTSAVVEASNKFELYAKHGSLYDQNGTEIVLKGMSWFGFEFSTTNAHNTRNVINGLEELRLRPTLDAIAEQGFNLLRLPIDYVLAEDAGKAGNAPGTYPAESGSAETNGMKTLQVLDWVIDECAQRGILILFDMQRIDGGKSKAEADQGKDEVPALWFDAIWPLDRGIEAWKRLLRRYTNAWNVIGADLKNEPQKPAYWGSADDANHNNWHWAAVRMATEILKEGPLRKYTIWVEGMDDGMNWGSNLKEVLTYPIQVDGTPLKDKLVYSMHCYGHDVVKDSPWWDTKSVKPGIEEKWSEEWGRLKDKQDVPVILGEWMGKSKEGTVDDEWTKRFVAYLRAKDAAANNRSKGSDASQQDKNNRWKHNLVWSFNGNDGQTGGLVDTGDDGRWSNGDGKPRWRGHKLRYIWRRSAPSLPRSRAPRLACLCPSPAS